MLENIKMSILVILKWQQLENKAKFEKKKLFLNVGPKQPIL